MCCGRCYVVNVTNSVTSLWVEILFWTQEQSTNCYFKTRSFRVPFISWPQQICENNGQQILNKYYCIASSLASKNAKIKGAKIIL